MGINQIFFFEGNEGKIRKKHIYTVFSEIEELFSHFKRNGLVINSFIIEIQLLKVVMTL